MASQPPGMPTPTWRGERMRIASGRTALAAHFEVKWHRTSLIQFRLNIVCA